VADDIRLSKSPVFRTQNIPETTLHSVKKLPILAVPLRFVAHHTADSMSLSSLKFLYWDPKDASFLQWNAYRPFKVDDFYRKRALGFLL